MLSQVLVDKARKVFAEFDKDKSGSIDFRELRDAMKTMNMAMSDSEVAKYLEEWDTSGDGTIEFIEFLALLEKSTSLNNDEDSDADMQDAWRALGGRDDQTGTIEVEEIRKTFRNFELDIDVDQLLIEIKLGGATQIDYDAFQSLLRTAKN